MVQIIKPRTLGILVRTVRRGKTPYYIVSALGLFDVSTPEVFLSDQALWPAVMKELPEGAVFDTGLPKPQGEVLVAGHAKAPSGTLTRAMLVEVMVGQLAKRVAVFGDRYWTPAAAGFVFTEPKPFTEMKIDLARMFGGADHPQNTVGVGYRATQLLDARQLAPLPNFEDPRRLIRTIDEMPSTVGLGPIDLMGRDRAKYAGTFDRAWQETLAPHPPLDMDPRYYCMAPEDQRIQGFFRGDEPVRVNGMTDDGPGYSGYLPGLRARAFVMRTSAPAGFLELDMKLDTVLLLGSHRKGVAVYRGMVPVADVEAKDLKSAMLAYERLRDPPRSIEYYAEVYRLRTDKEQAAKYAFAESQLTPERSDEEKQRRRKAREAHARAIEQRFADGQHLLMRRQMALAGMPQSLVPAKPDPVPMPVLLPTPEEIESGDIDLAEVIDSADKWAEESRAKLEAMEASAKAAQDAKGSFDIGTLLTNLESKAGLQTGELQKSLGEFKTQLPGRDQLVPSDASDENKGLAGQAHGVLESLIAGGRLQSLPNSEPVDGYEEACARFLDTPESGIAGKMRGGLQEARKTIDAFASQDVPAAEPGADSVDELLASLNAQIAGQPNSEATARAADVDQTLQKAFPALAGTGASPLTTLLNDLSGQAPNTVRSPADIAPHLDDANKQVEEAAAELKEAIAKARQVAIEPLFPDVPLGQAASLRFGMFVYEQWRKGADLRGRDLAGADLSGMDFSGADFCGAFLERANLNRTIMRGTNCAGAVFAGARLDAACFDDAVLKNANLSRASAKAASFQRVNLEDIGAVESNFEGADFESARFANTQMMKTDLAGARWAGVIARRIIFLKCRLDRLDASGASFERCQIVDCDAPAFNFRGGSMQRCAVVKFRAPQSDFSRSTLDGTGFASGAELQAALFDGASLRGVTLIGANLQGASFVKARLDGAVVNESQVMDSNFTAASLKRAQLASADLSRSRFFGANFFEAQLRRANLSGAAMRSANLYSTNFADADLTGADLTASNWGKSQLALETSHVQ